MVGVRGIAGTRVLQGLLALTKKHSSQSLEKACEIALAHGCWQLKTIRRLVGREAAKQEPLPFLEEHPLIRPLEDYAAVVARAIHRPTMLRTVPDRSSVSEGFRRHDWTKATEMTQQKSHQKRGRKLDRAGVLSDSTRLQAERRARGAAFLFLRAELF